MSIDQRLIAHRRVGRYDQILTSAGLCCFSQSLRAASMRVCHPRPVERNAAMTSGEYRIVADCLVGLSDDGLPRRTRFLPSYRSALAKNASSSSGASSGSTQVLFKSFNFSLIGFPHRDNAPHVTAWRPDHDNNSGIQFPYGDFSDLPIVLAAVFGGEVHPREDFTGSGEINAAFQQRFLPLVLVVFNFHTISVVTLNRKSNVDSLNCGRYTALATAKSVAGICTPELITAHDRALAVFLCAMHGYIQFMVGRAGQSSDWPVSVVTGSANPARLTTHEICTSSGELKKLTTEAAIMATIPVLDHPEITVINGQVVTSSVAIADYFLKRHDDVLKKIRTLECSSDFHARNFAEMFIDVTIGNGAVRRTPTYQITRDGFAFLAMGFTGKRAARFKEASITAFNQMERVLNGVPALPGPAPNAHAVYLYMTEIHRVWMAHLYPMLVASQSPLAHRLHDDINDALFASALVDRSLNSNKEVCDE